MKNIQNEITKHEEAIKKLKEELESQKDKVEWITYTPLGTHPQMEISSKPLHYDKTFEEQKASLKKGEEIASHELLQMLRNSKKYPDSFTDFWVNVSPNPDKISEENGHIAGFGADSGSAYLDCGRYPTDTSSSLGVFVIRRAKKIKSKESK